MAAPTNQFGAVDFDFHFGQEPLVPAQLGPTDARRPTEMSLVPLRYPAMEGHGGEGRVGRTALPPSSGNARQRERSGSALRRRSRGTGASVASPGRSTIQKEVEI